MRIAIAWEDEHCDPLKQILLSRRSARRPPSATGHIELNQFSVHGSGNFVRLVERSWPHVRKGAGFEHLVCVVDADKLHELLPSVRDPPGKASDVAAWHAQAEEAFQDHLRAKAGSLGSTVHGIALRWAKESLCLAAYDRPAANDKLGIDPQHRDIQRFLARCKPLPSGVPNAEFTNAYRKPLDCLNEMRRARALSPIRKGATLDDVLLGLTAADILAVCERVPDLDRILSLAWTLASSPAHPPTPASPRAGPARSHVKPRVKRAK